jgi:hypothetical protein
MSADELVAELRARGVIRGAEQAVTEDAPDRPWFVALLQGFAGWLAGIFLLLFIALAFKPDTTGGLVALGVILLGAAWGLYQAARDAVFLDQLALAISIAGQIALAWGILKDAHSALAISATLFGMQVLVALVMPNKTARVIATVFACIAWVYLVRLLLRPGPGDEMFFGEGPGHDAPMFGAWPILAGWLLTWIPLSALAAWLIARESVWMASGLRSLLRPALTGVLVALSFGLALVDPCQLFVGGIHAHGGRMSWWALLPLSSIGLALFAGWCAFRLRSSGLSGVAILGALLQMSRFYYLYGTTLMWKSTLMLALGASMLTAGVWVQRRYLTTRSAA